MKLACCTPKSISSSGSESISFPTPTPMPSLTSYIEFLIVNRICNKLIPFTGIKYASGPCSSGPNINRIIGSTGLRNQVSLYGYSENTILKFTCGMDLSPSNYTPYIIMTEEITTNKCGEMITECITKPKLIDYCDIATKNTTYLLINNKLHCVNLHTIYDFCRDTILNPLPSRGKWLR